MSKFDRGQCELVLPLLHYLPFVRVDVHCLRHLVDSHRVHQELLVHLFHCHAQCQGCRMHFHSCVRCLLHDSRTRQLQRNPKPYCSPIKTPTHLSCNGDGSDRCARRSTRVTLRQTFSLPAKTSKVKKNMYRRGQPGRPFFFETEIFTPLTQKRGKEKG